MFRSPIPKGQYYLRGSVLQYIPFGSRSKLHVCPSIPIPILGTDGGGGGDDAGTPPNSATGSAPGSAGSGSLWDSPTIQRVIAPLKHTLSVSAEHLPPRAKSPLARMQWAIRQSQKCQSVD